MPCGTLRHAAIVAVLNATSRCMKSSSLKMVLLIRMSTSRCMKSSSLTMVLLIRMWLRSNV